MERPIIKVGFCVAYDWELLKKSVPLVYNSTDSICLSIDKNRQSWSGKLYDFDEKEFKKWVAEIDLLKKIKIYEDGFYVSTLNPIENDNRQRTMMAEYMGNGGWHIQVDCDEYFWNFAGFVNYLIKLDRSPSAVKKPVNICVNFVPLIKKLDAGYIYIDFQNHPFETMPFATNRPEFNGARRNGHFNITSPFFVLHETWARNENDLLLKLNSWGHSNDFEKTSYVNKWRVLNENNYREIKNFHPIVPETWPSLAFCQAKDISEMMQKMPSPKMNIGVFRLALKNNRFLARLRQLFTN